MLAPVLAIAALAATPRLITELESRVEAGVFPIVEALEEEDEGNGGEDPGDDETAPLERQTDSGTLFQWNIVPSLTGRLDLRSHRFSLRYNPQILVQWPEKENRIELGPLVLHRGSADYQWRFTRGGTIDSAVAFESGDIPVNLFGRGAGGDDEDAPGFVPPATIVTYDRFLYSGQLSLETGRVESFTLGFDASYNVPRGDTTDVLLSTYQLGVGIMYERYAFHQTWAVLRTRMEHFDFYRENRQARSASVQGGLRWVQSRTLEWSLTAGLQFNVGDRVGVEAEATETIEQILPAAQILMQWTFVRSSGAVAGLNWDAGISGSLDQNVGLYIPIAYTTVGLNLFQPWGSFDANVRGSVPIVSADELQRSFRPTVYAASAYLTLPASAYLGFFMGGSVSQRAPPLGASNFNFDFLEAVAQVGLRLWWSSGRDNRLPRPSETLGGDEGN